MIGRGVMKTVSPSRRINVVVLDSPNRFGEGQALVNQGWSLYDAWAAEGRPTKKSTSL